MDERDKLVEAILGRPTQPTLEDAVAVIKFETNQAVYILLEIDGKLRKDWWDKRAAVDWE